MVKYVIPMKKKHYLFKILFFICFCVYAALPFLYTSEYGKTFNSTVLENREGRSNPLFDTTDFNVFIDLLLTRPSYQTGYGKNLHPFHILFKKRRATLASRNIEGGEQFKKSTVIVAHFRTPSEEIHGIAVQDDEPKLRESFYQSHSGLSPPSA